MVGVNLCSKVLIGYECVIWVLLILILELIF